MEKGGAAMTAHPVIQEAVAELCCIREASVGAVAKMRKEQHKGDFVKRATAAFGKSNFYKTEVVNYRGQDS